MKKKGYIVEFDIHRPNKFGGVTPERVVVQGENKKFAEKRMRQEIYSRGFYQGRYVAYYPDGSIKHSRVVKNPCSSADEYCAMLGNSRIVSREKHKNYTTWGKRNFKSDK